MSKEQSRIAEKLPENLPRLRRLLAARIRSGQLVQHGPRAVLIAAVELDERGAEEGGRGFRRVRVALEDAARPVDISAQAHLARWYRRFGFEIVGEVFVEDGIDHLPMRLR